MKLELFSTVFLLTLPGNLIASRPVQMEQTGCETRVESEQVEKLEAAAPNESEDVLLPRGAKVL